jgi:FtsZ-interacting cell division protein ZipA
MKMLVDVLVIGGMIGLIVMIVSGYHRKKIEQMKEREERQNKRG